MSEEESQLSVADIAGGIGRRKCGEPRSFLGARRVRLGASLLLALLLALTSARLYPAYAALYVSDTATGTGALSSENGGSANTAYGYDALNYNTTGGSNTAAGVEALLFNTAGSQNTAVGQQALFANTGSRNTALGVDAGSTDNASGSDNTFVGYNAGSNTTTPVNNATAVGANARVSESNALVLGGTGSNAVNVGIGTASPGHTLDVAGDIQASGMIHGTLDGNASGFTGALAGDVTGTQGATKVSNLQGIPLDLSKAPSTGQVLLYNGSKWVAGNAQDSQRVTGAPATVSSPTPGTPISATASCPSGTILRGGGGQASASSGVAVLTASYPSSTTVWTATAAGVVKTGSVTVTAYAICTLL